MPVSYANRIWFAPAFSARSRVVNAHAFQSVGLVVGSAQSVCFSPLTYSATVLVLVDGFGPLA